MSVTQLSSMYLRAVFILYFPLPMTRHFFFSNYLIWISVLVLVSNIFQYRYREFFSLLIFSIGIVLYGNFKNRDLYLDRNQSFSQWKSFKHLINKNSYCIPINPHPWMMCNNASYTNKNITIQDKYTLKNEGNLISIWILGRKQYNIKVLLENDQIVEPKNILNNNVWYQYYSLYEVGKIKEILISKDSLVTDTFDVGLVYASP